MQSENDYELTAVKQGANRLSTTSWAQIKTTDTGVLWSRMLDGHVVYIVRPAGQIPEPTDSGYASASFALTAVTLNL